MDTPARFRPLPYVRPTLLQRLLGRRPAANALATLVDRLRSADSPRRVTPAEVEGIGRDFGVDIPKLFHHQLQDLYRDYLLFCLTDRRLSDDEVADLEHLRVLFDLDKPTVQTIQRNVSRRIYLKSVDEVLADGTVDPAEREFLHRLQTELSIPEAVADNLLDVKRRQMQARERKRKR